MSGRTRRSLATTGRSTLNLHPRRCNADRSASSGPVSRRRLERIVALAAALDGNGYLTSLITPSCEASLAWLIRFSSSANRGLGRSDLAAREGLLRISSLPAVGRVVHNHTTSISIECSPSLLYQPISSEFCLAGPIGPTGIAVYLLLVIAQQQCGISLRDLDSQPPLRQLTESCRWGPFSLTARRTSALPPQQPPFLCMHVLSAWEGKHRCHSSGGLRSSTNCSVP